MSEVNKSQTRRCAEMVIGNYWLASVARIARKALEDGQPCVIYPPRADDYDRAEVLIEALKRPAETTLAVAADAPETERP